MTGGPLFKLNTLFINLLLSLNLLLVSCVDKKEPNQVKQEEGKGTPISKVQSFFENKLPNGWDIEISKITSAPFQWTGKISEGYKILISKKGEKEEVEKSYKDVYKKGERTYKAKTQLIRYFYEKLDAGFSFRMMERSHPASLERVTSSFVIISPSSMSDNKDHNVSREVYKIYRQFFENEKDMGVRLEEDYYSLKRPLTIPSNAKGKKAIIFEKKSPFEETLGIVTIK